MTDENDNRFPDNTDEFRLQQAQLARRRELARSLIDKGLQSKGEMVSGFYVPKNPWQNFAEAASGSYMDSSANAESKDLAARQSAQNNELLSSIPASGPERVQAQIRAMQNPSLRDVIKAQMGVDEHEAARLEKSEQDAANRLEKAEEAERNRIERGEQLAQDRVAREDLRRIPAQSVHVSVGGGGAAHAKDPVDADLDRQLKQARIDNLKNPKPVASERKAALAQDDLISRVDNAMAELDRNPDAVGFRTFVPNVALNRADPKGTAARAAIGELGAEKAHEIYGASFTAAERARADKFIPADGDDVHTIRTKLAGMKKMAEQAKARAMGQQPNAAPVQSPQRLKFNPATGKVE